MRHRLQDKTRKNQAFFPLIACGDFARLARPSPIRQYTGDNNTAEYPLLPNARFPKLILLLCCLCCSVNTASAETQPLRVAVAANFLAPMRDISHAFTEATQQPVDIVFASSGKLYAQISHGAPFDVFFSADQSKPSALAQKGLALANTQKTYAIGSLALVASKAFQQKRQPSGKDRIDSESLRHPDLKRLAMANPKVAPYGLAAQQVLQQLGLAQQTRGYWVTGENVAQTLHFVTSGNAQLGFVARSQLPQLRQGSTGEIAHWLVPEHLHQPILQDRIVLTASQNPSAAEALLAFMATPQSRELLQQYGFSPASDAEVENRVQ